MYPHPHPPPPPPDNKRLVPNFRLLHQNIVEIDESLLKRGHLKTNNISAFRKHSAKHCLPFNVTVYEQTDLFLYVCVCYILSSDWGSEVDQLQVTALFSFAGSLYNTGLKLILIETVMQSSISTLFSKAVISVSICLCVDVIKIGISFV